MKVPVSDYAYYSTISSGIFTQNTESIFSFLKEYFPTNEIIIPYHYYENWLAYPLKFLPGFNMHLVLNGITISFSLFLGFCCLYLILKSFLKVSPLLALAGAVSLLFMRGMMHYWPNIGQNFRHATDSIFYEGNQKMVYLLPVFFLALYFYLRRNEVVAILLLLILPAMNILLLPGILFGIVFYLTYNWLKNYGVAKFLNFIKDQQIIIIGIALFSVMLLIYLKGIASTRGYDNMVTSIGGIAHNLIDNAGKWMIINAVLLLVLVRIVYSNRQYLPHFIFLLCLTAGGLLGFALFDTNHNSWQIHTAIARFTGYGFYLLIPVALVGNLKWQRRSLAILCVAGILMFAENYHDIRHLFMKRIYAYTPEYIQQVADCKFKNPIGVKFVNRENRPDMQRNPVYAGVSNYLVLTENAQSTIVLNIENLLPAKAWTTGDTICSKDYRNNFIGRDVFSFSPFLRYCNFGEQRFSIAELEQKQEAFIRHYHPEFCIVEAGCKLPVYLNRYISSRFTDNGTGEEFLLLKY